MKFYTGSAGILARKAQIEPMLGRPLHAFKASMQLAQDDVLVGWGQKANTRQIKQKAHERGLPYWQLEDGFIGYIGHPARGGKAVSLIADPVGIYYDARQPSRLEQLIATPCDARMVARAEALTRELLRLGITKYNCYAADSGLPDALAARLHNDPRPKVLLIDQVAGDLSIPGALAATEDF
ncbi:capsular polysaccharide export protein, LipB/KpsS family, partial [Leclercia adecarboxylata]|nr:capsular polysaccharide biosynthesis protein [Leclercia adecarboxylata]